MNIVDVQGKMVRIGKTSITVKDENNKTRGVVKNICTWETLPPRRRFNFHKLISQSGIWGNEYLVKNLIFDENEMFLLKDMNRLEKWKDIIDHCDWTREEKMQKYHAEMQIYEKATEFGVHVLDVYLV